MTTSTTSPLSATPSGPERAHALDLMVFGASITKVVSAAAELGIPDLLADGPRSVADLCEPTGADPGALKRLVRTLAGLGLVSQIGPDRFELTDLGAVLRTDATDSVHGVVTMLWGEASWRSWGELVEAVRTGETGWDRVHGMSWIDYYARHPEASATFNTAMSQHTRDAAPALLAAAELSRFRSVVDVGGGDGTLLAEALRSEPGLTGTLFDLPSGLDGAAATLADRGVADRCRIAPGDFFAGVPGGADAYLLKQILHDWPDEAALDILLSCRAAMQPDARVLILERLVPEVATPEALRSLLLDMHMLVVTGGRERTEDEFRELLAEAGLELVAVSDRLPPFDYRVLEAAPAG